MGERKHILRQITKRYGKRNYWNNYFWYLCRRKQEKI